MKVLIANPPWVTEDRVGFRSNVRWPFTISKTEFELGGGASYHFPIYQAYALAILEQEGFDVAVIDCSVDMMGVSEFVYAVERLAPDLVVLEISTPSFDGDIVTAAAIKERLRVPVTVLGAHATVFHKEIIEKYLCIDVVARGEYEYTLLDLARALKEKDSLTSVPGITFRRKGIAFVNHDRPYIEDLNALPFPARDYFKWRSYHEPAYRALPWITIISSRGCPYRCTFCAWPQTMYGRTYRVRSAKNIVDEMEFCVAKYRPGEIFFDDNTFTIGKDRVIGICSEIIHRNLRVTWSCMGRTDTVDREMLAAMFNAGCRKIKFGVETGSPRIMAEIKKGLDLSRVAGAFDTARSVGMEVHGTFMIGLSGETRQTVRETVELACGIHMDSVQFSIATPFPGTEFFRQCVQNNWLVARNWSDYDGNFESVVSFPLLSNVEIKELLYFANQDYESRRKRDSIVVRFRKEARRGGMGGAFRRAVKSTAYRISRKMHHIVHPVGDNRSVAPGWGWYPFDKEEGGRPLASHSTVRIINRAKKSILYAIVRAPQGVDSARIQVFDGATLMATLDLGPSWLESSVPLADSQSMELTLRVQPTVICRKKGYFRHYGAIVKRIAIR